MGGCRCSYRNCTIKSDKKTHMFHFPVFEKLRCYQWIVNSHKFEFLDLSVSQVKNRVICQHHFRNEVFMNYKRDKLTFEAVPTADGPYCDSSKETNIDREAAERASLVVNDIESESPYIDRKANWSMKYIDFLVNVDISDAMVNVDTSDAKTGVWIDVSTNQEEPPMRKVPRIINKSLNNKNTNLPRKKLPYPTEYSKDIEYHQQNDQSIEQNSKLIELIGTQNLSPIKENSPKTILPYPAEFSKDIEYHQRNDQSIEQNLKLIGSQNLSPIKENLPKTILPYPAEFSKDIEYHQQNDQSIEQNLKLIGSQNLSPIKENLPKTILPYPAEFSKDIEYHQQNDQSIEQKFKLIGSQNLSDKNESPIIMNSNENQEIHNISNLSIARVEGIENISHYQQPAVLMIPLNQCSNINSSNQSYYNNNHQNQSFNQSCSNVNNNNLTFNSSQNSVQPQNNEKVRILSEKTIYQPLSFVGQFVPVLPSLVLQAPNRTKQTQNDSKMVENITQMPIINNVNESVAFKQEPNISKIESTEDLKGNDVVIKDPPKIDILEIEPCVQKAPKPRSYIEFIENDPALVKRSQDNTMESEEKVDRNMMLYKNRIKEKSTESVSNSRVSLLKSKVPPERLAAIEKKRIFNKKLRDIVASCLEKPDEKDEKEKAKASSKSNVFIKKDTENVDISLSRANSRGNTLSSSQDYTLTYLEARMKKMENLLQKKIEQNSNQISDLKNCIVPTSTKRNSVHTQTPCSEQAHKIFLYEEISKYLSPKAKDLIYEELFIYKYAEYVDRVSKESESKPKRKRRR